MNERDEKFSSRHYSDCSIYNAPAYEPGPCDCGAEEYSKKAAISLGEDQDKVLIEALNAKIGEGLWTIENVCNRLVAVKRPGWDEPTTYYLDGNPLVTFYPPEMHTERTETGQQVRFTQNVERHQ